MEKDFQKWHILKARIHGERQPPLFRAREIWWCAIGANVGVEEDGKHDLFERPVLVVRKFNREMLWGLPMTAQKKEGMFYCPVWLHREERTAILSQIRTWSAKRLIRRIGKVSDRQFAMVQDALAALLKETDSLRSPRVPSGNL